MALFEAQHLHKRFGDRVVLEEINLSFEAGQLSGIMGPNGAGKTTCFNVLTGRYKPNRGKVLFDGQDITGLTPRTIARKGISRSFQIMNLFDDFSAIENVLIAVPQVRDRGFNMSRRVAADSVAMDKAAMVLEQCRWCWQLWGCGNRRCAGWTDGRCHRCLCIGMVTDVDVFAAHCSHHLPRQRVVWQEKHVGELTR